MARTINPNLTFTSTSASDRRTEYDASLTAQIDLECGPYDLPTIFHAQLEQLAVVEDLRQEEATVGTCLGGGSASVSGSEDEQNRVDGKRWETGTKTVLGMHLVCESALVDSCVKTDVG